MFSVREKLRELNSELLKKNSFIDEMEPKYTSSCEWLNGEGRLDQEQEADKNQRECVTLSGQRVEELEEALKKKDDDMKQMEERYKKYLEKAKSVSLAPSAVVF